MPHDLTEFADACWQDVLEKVRGAAVYIDHAATECLHWLKGDGAYLSLIDAGAHSVHEMAMFNFQYVKVQGTAKAVFIITSSDPAFYQRTLNMIIQKNSFYSCTIFCAIHHTILRYSSIIPVDGENSYEKLKKNILDWMREANSDGELLAEVVFQPIFLAPITKNLFVTPPIDRLMPPLVGEITDDHDAGISFLVASLHSLFTHFNIKEDIYSMGSFSEMIAERLETLPAAVDRRKRLIGKSGVSLILIDRTLDLCTATKNDTDCLLSRIFSTLPHLSYHNNDVAINMTPLCPDLKESPLSMTVPGCLATNNNDDFDLLIEKKQKDLLLTLNKWMIEMFSSEIQSPKARLGTRVTAHSLEKMLHNVKDIHNLKNVSKKLQIVMAVVQCLKSSKTAQLDLLVSLEKLILQNLAVSRDSTSVLAQIGNIIKNRISRGLDMEHLLVLLIYIYSLASTEIRFASAQEDMLKSALNDAIYENIIKCNEFTPTEEVTVFQQILLLLGVSDEVAARKSANKMTDQIINLLHTIGRQRVNLSKYKSPIVKTSPQEMAYCSSLIEQLLTDIFHPSRPDIKDLRRKSSSLLSAGFNLLTKGKTSHHPADNPWLIIYIVGGVTADEARLVKEFSCSLPSTTPQITLAGCRMLNPLDIADRILLSNVNL